VSIANPQKLSSSNAHIEGAKFVRFYWLLPSFLSIFLFALPASAAKLVFWRYYASQNRLVFKTDAGVQPKATLLANPTRLIIDLPGTSFSRPTVRMPLNGRFSSLRVGQLDQRTTRLVIQLNPGYTLNAQQVLVRGATPVQWSVQLPVPQRVEELPSGSGLPPLNTLPPQPPAPVPPRNDRSGFQLQNLQVTRDGFFIRTTGQYPRLAVRRSDDRRTINIDLENATLSSSLYAKNLPINRYGVSSIQFSQLPSSPRITRVTLNLRENSPNWQASFSSLDGIVVLPQGITAAQIENSDSGASRSDRVATIQSVELVPNGPQLLIRADRPVRATSRWDNSEGVYRITIPAAKLAERVRGPQLDTNSPVVRVRLQQQDSNIVEVLVKPAPGVVFGELNQISDQLISLQVQGNRQGGTPVNPTPVPPSTISNPPLTLPRVSNRQVVVLVDPGHGGKDSGAPGVGGILEKHIILSISQQVAALLQQQGIQAVLTRNSDYFVSLAGRVQMVPRVNADLFVSIHANSIGNRPDVNGLETYYYGSRSQGLAQTIHNSVLQSVAIGNRRVRSARFYVLRNNSVPATLVEVGFVTSPQEGPKLASPDYQRQMAAAIARGILLYVQQNF
jgi:N-acetylmuramoyl-L-alanine amidase